jgi:hypothetical protein
VLHIACCLWAPNHHSQPFSRCYDESWVERLYRGFARNLTRPFRFVCFTDRPRDLCAGVEQLRLRTATPGYGCLIEPFRLDARRVPLIVCGLDMVIVGNVDHLADWCARGDRIAAPRDPYRPERLINPVVLSPPGIGSRIFEAWSGENDMEWLRRFPWQPLDDLWPGQLAGGVLSLKAHDVRRKGLQGACICYMHGTPKPHQLLHLPWVREHWR